MTPDEQIARLVSQRNALWKLIDVLAMDYGYNPDYKDIDKDDPDHRPKTKATLAITRAADQAEKIVGNTYIVEGFNPRTGEVEESGGAFKPYQRNKVKPWG
jgi:hypothetical protein